MAIKPIPDGYHSVAPYLIVERADALLDFVKAAFDAVERVRMDAPDGSVGHAELEIGDSVVMLAEASDRWPPAPGNIHLYVEDCDATYAKALAAGATSIQEPSDQFYGDRSSGVRDPVGNTWWIVTHVEDVPPRKSSGARRRKRRTPDKRHRALRRTDRVMRAWLPGRLLREASPVAEEPGYELAHTPYPVCGGRRARRARDHGRNR